MRNQRLLIRPLVLVALALAVLLAVAVGLVYFTLDAPGRAQFARLLGPRAALLVLAWALGVVAAMAALQRWWVPRVSALPELAEQTRALVNASAPQWEGHCGGGQRQGRYPGHAHGHQQRPARLLRRTPR